MRDGPTARLTEWGLELRRSRFLYRIGLASADRVVVMTETARELARGAFGIDDALVIRLFAELPPEPVTPSREAFLWIGGLVEVKNPLAYLELARRIPEASFWMVGTERLTGQEVVARVRSEAQKIPNLQLLPPMSADEILTLYERAVAVVSTSFVEGFGNVLLESWARGSPVLSLRYDPDGVIERHNLGVVAHGSVDELAAAARRLWAGREAIDPEPYRAYVARYHDSDVVGAQWAGLVSELLGE
jgi:glycosyltransferase involved in cell wall biosynthesis